MFSQNPVFIPGPTNIPERLRHAVNVPSIDHRSASFGAMFKPLFAGVKDVLKTKAGEVVLFPATGTAGWEAAISNTLSPGDKVLACRHGMFSHRWIDMCQRHGLDVQVLTAAWGAGAPAAAFEAALKADANHEIKAVLVTHNETATGVRSEVAAIRRALNAAGHPALLLVEGVSSIASMDVRMDEWGGVGAVTGSQKGCMLRAGLAWGEPPIDASAVIPNALAPPLSKWHLAAGVSHTLGPRSALHAAISYVVPESMTDNGRGDLFSFFGAGTKVEYAEAAIVVQYSLAF